jgi:hypothetical protein
MFLAWILNARERPWNMQWVLCLILSPGVASVHILRMYVCTYVCMHFLIYLFIYLFVVYLTTLFSNEDYTASNDRAVSEWQIGNDLEGICRCLISRCYPSIRREGIRKTTINPRPECHSSGRDLNSVPSEYKGGVLSTRKRKFGYRDAATLFYTDLLSKYSNVCSGCPLIESVRYCTQWIVSRYSNNPEAYIISVYFLICRP